MFSDYDSELTSGDCNLYLIVDLTSLSAAVIMVSYTLPDYGSDVTSCDFNHDQFYLT